MVPVQNTGVRSIRSFSALWSVEDTVPCFIVRDANEQALAFVYCEYEPGGRAKTQPADQTSSKCWEVASCSQSLTASSFEPISGEPRLQMG